MVTGESVPVEKVEGDRVIGGTLNKTGSFLLEATQVGTETVLAQIVKMVKQAQGSKAPIQRIADRIAGIFVPIVFAIAAVTFGLWWILGPSLETALLNTVAVLIVACPCAMGLATPTAIMVGTGRGAEFGLLVKGGEVLESAHRLNTIILDKTGTLTAGRPEVTDVVSTEDKDKLIGVTATAEMGSEHPFGEAVVRAAAEQGVELSEAENFKAIPGAGIEADVDGAKILVGNRGLLEESGISLDAFAEEAERLEEEGKTVLFVGVDGVHTGVVAVADVVKDESARAVSELQRMGIQVALMTGDRERMGKAIARQVGIERVLAEVQPEDKANQVAELQSEGKTVGMVGDGINDAPALARADVGIAIGTGTDVAIESAGITLMSGNLYGVGMAIRLSRRTMRIIRQNLFWAFAYNTLLIPVAALGMLNSLGGPMIAAAAMAISSVSVVSNSLRLKRYDPRSEAQRERA